MVWSESIVPGAPIRLVTARAETETLEMLIINY